MFPRPHLAAHWKDSQSVFAHFRVSQFFLVGHMPWDQLITCGLGAGAVSGPAWDRCTSLGPSFCLESRGNHLHHIATGSPAEDTGVFLREGEIVVTGMSPASCPQVVHHAMNEWMKWTRSAMKCSFSHTSYFECENKTCLKQFTFACKFLMFFIWTSFLFT